MAGAGAAARVEVVGDALDLQHRDRMGNEPGVQALAEPKGRPVARKIDMRDLARRMDPRVGAPRSVRGRAIAGHGEDRALERLLHRDTVVLALPADEGRAVVFEDELETRHAAFRAVVRIGAVRRPHADPYVIARCDGTASGRRRLPAGRSKPQFVQRSKL